MSKDHPIFIHGRPPKSLAVQSGSVLFIVLWMLSITAIIAATLATEVRLSSQIVHTQKLKVNEWAETLEALHAAEMELMLHKMPLPVIGNWELMKKGTRPASLTFDGSSLSTAYPAPSTMDIRIFDHSGKISLTALNRNTLKKLLQKKTGNDKIALEGLLDSWEDWIDPDSLKRINGAEDQFYQSLTPPYLPRNAPLESVEELLEIRGFRPLFENINISSSFTLYNTHSTINPNLATEETLQLLPGLSASSAHKIIEQRQQQHFIRVEDLIEILSPEEFSATKGWFGFHYSSYYTIAITPRSIPSTTENGKTFFTTTAYTEDVYVQNHRTPPMTVTVRGSVPITIQLSSSP